jgi:hypothetical protein
MADDEEVDRLPWTSLIRLANMQAAHHVPVPATPITHCITTMISIA